MGFASDSGYTPVSIDTMMTSVMTNVNTQFGQSYTMDTFVGTNFYKFFYALIQKLQENEVKTAEIFTYLQQYFTVTNESIQRPVVTNPGLIEVLDRAGFITSVKKPIDGDAGKIFICVDKDVDSGNWEDSTGYAADKAVVAGIIRDSTCAGCVTQGTEVSALTLTNGQSFDFKYNLPNRITTDLRLTLTTSLNNMVAIGDPDMVKALLLANIAARYSLGEDFAPERYFTTQDAPWTSTVLLEYSSDGGSTYDSVVFTANYDDLFEFDLARVHLVEV